MSESNIMNNIREFDSKLTMSSINNFHEKDIEQYITTTRLKAARLQTYLNNVSL